MNTVTKLTDFPTYCNEYKAKKNRFDIILDLFAAEVQGYLNNNSIDTISFQAPLSVIYFETELDYIVGFTEDKSTIHNRCIVNINIDDAVAIDNDKIISELKTAGRKELGLEFKYFTQIDSALLNENENFISVHQHIESAISIDDFRKRWEYLFSHERIFLAIQRAKNILLDCISKKDAKIMRMNPIFKARDLSIDENMIFCALPFTDIRLEIFDEVIKPEIEKQFGMNTIRSGNIFQPNLNIMESIWTYINQAKAVIIDLSDKNPNVFYELGICHTIGKPVIAICDKESLANDYGGSLPFDIGVINTIFYKNQGNGMEELKKALNANIRSVIEQRPVIL